MTIEEIRHLNGYQFVRLTMTDGTVFEGEAIHDPAGYCFHEFGRDEEAVEIDHWLFYLSDIASLEPSAESDGNLWMSRPLHRMHLDSQAFAAMEDEKKNIELRLYDEKRRRIQAGDVIRFESTDDETDVLFARVTGMRFFASFDELYAALPLTACGYSEAEAKTASPRDMDKYYAPEEQKKWGVVGIELSFDF